MAYNFEICKSCLARAGRKKYELRNAKVWVCSKCGFHYTDHLDPTTATETRVRSEALTAEKRDYIQHQLQYNSQRFETHVDLVKRRIHLKGIKVLDIGCGGGVFLSLLKEQGAEVYGIDLDDARVEYARTVYGLTVNKYPVEHEYWQTKYCEKFDVVTLWDVIEHVNFPIETLQAAANVMRRGGLLFLDTPCRDAFYHRFGQLSYRLSMGKFPTFLNAMYSNHMFGHKQIFSTVEMRELFERSRLNMLQLDKIHELSFPYRFYLKNLFKSNILVEVALPFANIFFKFFNIRNKMVAVGRKIRQSDG